MNMPGLRIICSPVACTIDPTFKELRMILSPDLAIRIGKEIAGLKPEPIGHINYEGIRYQALPLFGTIGEVWLLRQDGSLWRADSDLGLALEPLPDALHTIALVAGAARYPWLEGLLPSRPLGATQCGACGGSGRLGPENALFCNACGALGWIPL
jgi:hypothetical protein